MATLTLAFSVGFVWVFMPFSSCIQVPQIESCYYNDAKSVQCTWKRLKNDNNQTYRLTYEKTSDPKYMKMVHTCYPNKISLSSSGETIESCVVDQNVTYWAMYYFSLTSLCTEQEVNCTTQQSKKLMFECNFSNVRLQTPPSNLRLDGGGQSSFKAPLQLTWERPSVTGSMLLLVWKPGHLHYKLMYKILQENENTTAISDGWKKWYQGSKPRFVLHALLPNVRYAAWVVAGIVIQENNVTWSPKSKIIEFNSAAVPANYITTLQTTVETNTMTDDEIQKITNVETMTIILLIAFFILLAPPIVYVVLRKKGSICMTKRKLPRPAIMISMTELHNKESYLEDDVEHVISEYSVPLILSIDGNDEDKNSISNKRSKVTKMLLSNQQDYRNNCRHRQKNHASLKEGINSDATTDATSQLKIESLQSRSDFVESTQTTDITFSSSKDQKALNKPNAGETKTSQETTSDSSKDLNSNLALREFLVAADQESDVALQCPYGSVPPITKYSSDAEDMIFSEGSGSIDYVIDSFESPFPIRPYLEPDDNQMTEIGLEKAKKALLFRSESVEKISDYVKQAIGFDHKLNQPITLFAIDLQSSSAEISDGTLPLCKCADTAERLLYLYKYMKSQRTCPFCEKQFPTYKNTFQSLSSPARQKLEGRVMRMRSLTSGTLSLNSGYSQDAATLT